ncbi:MAG: tetratricopeptide repeat protein [Bdellovibrionales bacterium]|nr:tetratricopeptide repeat protein [Bdellovibrionales bacterium]
MAKDKKNDTESLLEGFDDTFDDILSKKGQEDKTELFDIDESEAPTKTQHKYVGGEYTESLDELFVPEDDSALQGEQTQMLGPDEDLMPEGAMYETMDRTDLLPLDDEEPLAHEPIQKQQTELIGEEDQFSLETSISNKEQTQIESDDDQTQLEDDEEEKPQKIPAAHTNLIGEEDSFEIETQQKPQTPHKQKEGVHKDSINMSGQAKVIQGNSTEMVSPDSEDDDWFSESSSGESDEKTQLEESDGIEFQGQENQHANTELVGEDQQFSLTEQEPKQSSSSGTEMIGEDEFSELFGETDLHQSQTDMLGSSTEGFESNHDDTQGVPKTSMVSSESTDLLTDDSEDISSLFADETGGLMDDSKTRNEDIPVDEVLKDYLEPSHSKASPIESSQSSIQGMDEELVPSMAATSQSRARKRNQRNKKGFPTGMLLGTLLILSLGAYVFISAKYTESGFFGVRFDQKKVEETPEQQLELIGKKFMATRDLILNDRYLDYEKAQVLLKEILAIDSQHLRSNTRMVEVLLLKHDFYLEPDQNTEVRSYISKLEKLAPNQIELSRAKSMLLFYEGKYAESLAEVKKILGQDVKDVFSMQLEGEIYFQNKEYGKALNQFDKVLENEPTYIRAKYYRGKIRLIQKKYEEAQKIFKSLEPLPHPASSLAIIETDFAQGKANTKEKAVNYLESHGETLSAISAATLWKKIEEIESSTQNYEAAIYALEKALLRVPLKDQYAYELGHLYMKTNNYEKAAQQYAICGSLNPNNVSYIVSYGGALRKQGKPNQALDELEKAVEKDPKHQEGLYQKAITLNQLGYPDDSEKTIRANLKEHPEHLQSLILLGDLLVQRNDFKEAQKKYSQALEISPQSQEALNALGSIYAEKEQWRSAQKYFEQSKQQNPNDVDTLINLARSNMYNGKLLDAGAQVNKARKIDPGNPEVQVVEGELMYQQGDYDNAMKQFKNVLNTYQRDFKTRVKLGRVYVALKDYDNALKEFQRAYTHNENYFFAHYYMGITKRTVGDLEGAAQDLEVASKLWPEYEKGFYELGLTRLAQNFLAKGKQAMDRAFEINPKYVEPLIAMGEFYYETSYYDDAIAMFQKAKSLRPTNITILYSLARSEQANKKPEKAMALYKEVIRIDPTQSKAYLSMGLIEEESRKLPSALQYYQKAKGLNPSDPTIHYRLGFLYKDLNQPSQAISSLKKYLSLVPNAVERQDILDQIDRLSRGT